MSSLAHEGNPKEAELVIKAGEVLSTARLDIQFRFPTRGADVIPSGNPIDKPTVNGRLCDNSQVNQIIGTPTGGWQFDVGSKNLDNESMIVAGGNAFYGKCCVRVCCPPPYGTVQNDPAFPDEPDIPCVIPAYCYVNYDSAIADPMTGVLFCTLTSTKDDCVGVGFVLNHFESKLEVYTFDHAPLKTGGDSSPTLVTTASFSGIGEWFFETDYFAPPAQYMFFPNVSPFIYAELRGGIILDSITAIPFASAAIVKSQVGVQGINVCVFGLGNSQLNGRAGWATWRALNTECSPCYTVMAPFDDRDATCTQVWAD